MALFPGYQPKVLLLPLEKCREMVESQNDKCISFTDTSTAEHFLPISMESDLGSVGYIGHFSVPDGVPSSISNSSHHCGQQEYRPVAIKRASSIGVESRDRLRNCSNTAGTDVSRVLSDTASRTTASTISSLEIAVI